MEEDKYFDEAFSSLAESLLAEYHVPSISIALVDEGKTHGKSYGLARFPSTPATQATLYFTGSTTKAILAAAIGVLIKNPDKIKPEQKPTKPLSWNTTLKSILGDDFVLEDKYVTENATIEDALCHRVGMSGHEAITGGFAGERPRGLTKGLRHLGPLNMPFRTAMQYNNFMYAVAGDVIETLTGMTCGEALRDLIWKPLGMNHTFWHLQEVIDAPEVDKNKDMSRGYFWLNKSTGHAENPASTEGHFIPDEFINFAGIAPAGAIISSVNDYAKWIRALLDAASGSVSSSSSPITQSLFEELTAPRITTGIPLPQNAQISPKTYALGWLIYPSTFGPFHPIVTHSGGLTGYGTMLHLLPNDAFGVVTLGNTSLTSSLVGHILTQELISRKMDLRSAGRERELKEFNTMMKAERNGLEQCVDFDSDGDRYDIDPEIIKEMFKKTAATSGQNISLDEYVHKSDKEATKEIEGLAGIYKHGAYGQFRVSFVPSTTDTGNGAEKMGENTTSLVHLFRRNKKLVEVKDEVRSSCHSLRVQGMGNRTWRFEWLLHPRRTPTTPDDKDKSHLEDVKQKENEVKAATTTTWFDQEGLNGHGFSDEDVVSGIPTGTDEESGVESGKCKKGIAWECTTWTGLGAAFVRDDDGDGGSRGKKTRMGLTLGNSMSGIDGTLDEGWEDKKIWFEKIE